MAAEKKRLEEEEAERQRLAKERAEADARLKQQLLDMEAIEKKTLKTRDNRKVEEERDAVRQKKVDKQQLEASSKA